MRFSLSSALVVLICVCYAFGHRNEVSGTPILFGRHIVKKWRQEKVVAPNAELNVKKAIDTHRIDSSQNASVCGAGIGSCAAGFCCSGAGYCGTGSNYCQAPDCQFQYGPACDANQLPAGSSTSSVLRPRIGNVTYGGAGVLDCESPGSVALTFDDGPFTYTGEVLDILKRHDAKATFFITGNNLGKGAIDKVGYPWANLIKRMHSEGHQIASHTWSHQDLSTLTQAQRRQQMYSNEMALRNILGFFPTYMRPPYSSCTAACQDDMAVLGYHITYFDLDTEDYLNTEVSQAQTPRNNFKGNISTTTPRDGDWLAIAHDIHQQTAQNLTEYMLQTLQSQGYRAVTLGECLNDPAENWYRSAPPSPPSSPAVFPPSSTSLPGLVSPTALSREGTCGGSTGFTCLGSTFGDCCSKNGWWYKLVDSLGVCQLTANSGSSDDYCFGGCQSSFGHCGLKSSISASPTPAPTGKVSFDGSCGGAAEQTCLGSTFGTCCSPAGWCGWTTVYCKAGCQTKFGTCR